MAHFTRTLYFRSHDLGKDSVFVLSFCDEKTPGMYETVFPTVLKTTGFGETGRYTFKFVYHSELGFTRAQISSRDVVDYGTTYTPVNAGESTVLTKAGNPPVYSFSKPESIQPASVEMAAKNQTDSKESIGLGFFARPDREPTQVLVFQGIGAGSSIHCEFTPILEGYMVDTGTHYEEKLILRATIKSPILFKEDLCQLGSITDWTIEYNKGDGKYKITRDYMQHPL